MDGQEPDEEQLPDPEQTSIGESQDGTDDSDAGVGQTQVNDSEEGAEVPWNQPTPKKSKVRRSAALQLPELSDLQQTLIEVGLATEQLWDEALDHVGPNADLKTFLYHLTSVEAARTIPSANVNTVLTSFQVKEILNGNFGRLRFDQYLVLDRLGKGGMGEVLKALNSNLYRIEALKTVAPQSSGGPLETTARKRFKREAEILAALDHPYITKVWNAGFKDDLAYIAMEYVEGRDFEAIVREHKRSKEPISISWAVERIIMVAEALRHAHQRRVLHRDVKPSNIMVTDDRSGLKVLDLGIARLLSESDEGPAPTSEPRGRKTLTNPGGRLGTPAFMSPEQWCDASSVKEASDVYSLGITFFYLLTGHLPFDGENIIFQHLNDKPPRASRFRSDIPRPLDRVIRKMLAKKPEHRYSSADELISALRPFGDRTPEESPFRRTALAAGLAAVFALSAVQSGPMVITWMRSLRVDPVAAQVQELSAKIDEVDVAQPEDLFRRGELYYRQERWRQCVDDVEAALDRLSTGRRIDARLLLGKAYLHLGKPSEAAGHLEVAARRLHDDPDVHFKLATARLAEGKFPQAINSGRAALALDPANDDVRAFIVNSYRKYLEHLAEASSHELLSSTYDEAVAGGYFSADQAALVSGSLVEWGRELRSTDTAKAKDVLERSAGLAPVLPEAHWELAQLALATKRSNDALESLNEVIRLRSGQTEDGSDTLLNDARLARGRLQLQRRRYDEAIEDLKVVVDRDPSVKKELAFAYLGRAQEHQTAQRLAEASADLDEVLRCDPTRGPSIRALRASVRYEQGKQLAPTDPDRAIEVLETAIEDAPATQQPEYRETLADMLWDRATRRSRSKQFQQAAADFEAVARYDGGRASKVGQALSNVYLEWAASVDGTEQQLTLLEKSRNSDPSNAAAHRRLGEFRLGNGDYDVALKALEEAMRLDPKSRPALKAQAAEAKVRLARKQFDEATLTLEQLSQRLRPELEDLPKDLARQTRSYLADAYAEQGRRLLGAKTFASSVEQFARAVELIEPPPEVRRDYATALLGQGRAYVAGGEKSKASSAFKTAVGFNPQLAEAHFELGLLLMDQRDYVGAQRSLTAAIDHGMKDPRVLRARAGAHEAAKDYLSAYRDVSAALKSPDAPKQWLEDRARLRKKAVDAKVPLHLLDADQSPEEWYAFAQKQLEAGNLEQAESSLRYLLQKDKENDARYRITLAHLIDQKAARAFKDGEFKRAVELWNEAFKGDPSLAGVNLNLGRAHQRLKQFEPAQAALERALANKSTRDQAQALLVELLVKDLGPALQKQDLSKAKEVYDRAVALDPKNSGALAGRAAVLRKSGKLAESLEDLLRAYESASSKKTLTPGILQVGVEAAQQQLKTSPAQALRTLDRVKAVTDDRKALDPLYLLAYEQQIKTADKAANYDAAIDLVTKSLAIDPDNKELSAQKLDLHRKRAQRRFSQARIEDALADAKVVLKQRPRDLAMLRLVSTLHMMLHHHVAAVETLKRLIGLEIDPKSKRRAQSSLATTYSLQASANDQKAVGLYQLAAEVEPDDAKRKEYRRRAATLLEAKARKALADDDHESAASALLQAAALDESAAGQLTKAAVTALAKAASNHLSRKEYLKAANLYARASDLAADSQPVLRNNAVNLYLLQGNVHYQEKDFDRAIAVYSQAIRFDKTASKAYMGRATTHLANQQYEEALSDYATLTRLEPDNALAHEWCGRLLSQYRDADKRDIPEAAKAVGKAAVLNPKLDVRLLEKLVQWLCTDKLSYRDGEAAVRYATMLCERSEYKNPEHLVLLAAAHAENGQSQQASEAMNRALQAAPSDENRALRDFFAGGNKLPGPRGEQASSGEDL